jgi:hypothetical protein
VIHGHLNTSRKIGSAAAAAKKVIWIISNLKLPDSRFVPVYSNLFLFAELKIPVHVGRIGVHRESAQFLWRKWLSSHQKSCPTWPSADIHVGNHSRLYNFAVIMNFFHHFQCAKISETDFVTCAMEKLIMGSLQWRKTFHLQRKESLASICTIRLKILFGMMSCMNIFAIRR